jgi:DNA-binding MarR family transcriptional regulator
VVDLVPALDPGDPAMLLERLVGAASRETAGRSTLFLYESGLTFPQIIVMSALRWEGAQPISTLAQRLRLSLAATSQLVDRLVDGEFVSRTEDPSDRRVRRVELRPRGRKFMDVLNEIRRRELSEAFDRLPVPVRRRLTAALSEAVEAIGGGAAGADASGKRQRHRAGLESPASARPTRETSPSRAQKRS